MDEFAAPTGIDWTLGNDVGMVRYNTGNNVVLFYNRAKHDPIKSRELGYPHHETVVYVKIHAPGDRLNIVDRPATQDEIRRYPVQWAQFQQQKEQLAPGAPIELLYPDKPAIAANLRAHGVQTIEQCAEMNGQAIDGLMGGQEYCNYAKRWLADAQKGVHQSQFRAEIEDKDRKIRVLEQQLETLKGQVAAQSQAQANLPTMQELLALVAQRSQAPQFPPPGLAPAQVFDAQAAQIAATGKEIGETAKRARGRPRKVV